MDRCRLKYLVLLLLLFIGYGSQVWAQRTFNRYDTLRGANTKFRSCYDITHYDLNVTIVPEQKYLEGYNAIRYEVIEDFDTLQLDLDNQFIIDSLTWNDTQIRYRQDSNTIYVIFDQGFQKKGTTGTIKVYYSGFPRTAKQPPWDGGFVWKKDRFGNPWVGVACQGVGASMWWPCKDHLSDEPDSMDIHITVPEGLKAISNGQYRGVEENSGYQTYHWHVSYPINNYNVSLYIGDYIWEQDKFEHRFSTQQNYDLMYVALRQDVKKHIAHFKEEVPEMLRIYEKILGSYPFANDGYKVVQAPYWGMEHQSAIAYGNETLMNDFGFDFILIHESGHEYWGNAVSISDHGELWIHEALTTYLEALFLEVRDSMEVAQNYLNMQREKIANKMAILGPLDVNFNEWPDPDMYYKGTWVLHTLRSCMNNDSLWFGSLKSLYDKHKYNSINTEDVIQHFDALTSYSLRPFFDHYLNDTVNPVIEYKLERINKKKVAFSYRWTNVKDDFKMPMEFKLSNGVIFRDLVTTSWKTVELKRVISATPQINKFLVDAEEVVVE